jgi:hypothetical protein
MVVQCLHILGHKLFQVIVVLESNGQNKKISSSYAFRQSW